MAWWLTGVAPSGQFGFYEFRFAGLARKGFALATAEAMPQYTMILKIGTPKYGTPNFGQPLYMS